MAKFKIIWQGAENDREVEADSYRDRPPFIDFERSDGGMSMTTVLRVRADDVSEIQLVQ